VSDPNGVRARLLRQVRLAAPDEPTLVERFGRLIDVVEDLGSCVVALSGGIDSSLVLEVTSQLLGDRCVAVTADSPALPAWDRADAREAGVAARSRGATWRVIATHELEDPRYLENSAARCYFCKAEVYGRLRDLAGELGLAVVVDGANATDAAGTDRPGMAAATALGIRSPLVEAGLTKDDVRALARALGMREPDRPASACLSSRIPHGVRITPERLRRVEEAELRIRGLGFGQVRVRDFGDTARVEVDRPEMDLLLARSGAIDEVIRSIGFERWTATEYVGRGAVGVDAAG
jgi:uncharacterized protein